MALINEHFLKLPDSYFFSDIAKKVNSFRVTHPKTQVIDLGKEDVTLPLPSITVEALHCAVDEMARQDTFRGYSPHQGYDFLVDAILKHDFVSKGIQLTPGEVFVTNSAKESISNMSDLLRHDNSIGVTDPIYPLYIDANVSVGRAGALQDDGKWSNVVYMPCSYENHFVPRLPEQPIDIIYLCYPDNPTGTVQRKAELRKWINYAIEHDTLILFDATYEAYIRDKDVPHSIYEIKGAKKVAVEFRSFSMSAGFTGLQCGYVVIPKELTAATLDGRRIALTAKWERLSHIRFGTATYLAQRAAESLYTPEGKKAVKERTDYYLANAALLKEALTACRLTVYGGENAPFLWVKTPDHLTSMKFFEHLLYETGIIVTPGVGFGPGGEGYVQFMALCSRKECEEAVRRIRHWRIV